MAWNQQIIIINKEIIMLKRIALVLLMAAGTINNANAEKSGNLIKNTDFSQGLKNWFVSCAKVYSTKEIDGKNILIVKGAPGSGGKNNSAKCIQNIKLSADMVSGRKFTLGVTVKAIKISGRLKFAVREINAKGASITYQEIVLKRRDNFDWKKFTKSFTASSKTVKLAVYIVAYYLEKEDEIQVKDIFLKGAKK
jgi:Carbohydrate binding domain